MLATEKRRNNQLCASDHISHKPTLFLFKIATNTLYFNVNYVLGTMLNALNVL